MIHVPPSSTDCLAHHPEMTRAYAELATSYVAKALGKRGVRRTDLRFDSSFPTFHGCKESQSPPPCHCTTAKSKRYERGS